MHGGQKNRRTIRAIAAVCAVVASALVAVSGPALAHVPHDDIGGVDMSPAYATDQTAIAIVRNRLMRTTDGGVTWAELVTGVHGKDFESVAFDPFDAQRLIVGTKGAGLIYRSTDGGDSFTASSTGLTLTAVTDLAWSPSTADLVLAAGAPFGVARSTDGGATWSTSSPSSSRVDALTFAPSGDLYAGDRNGDVWRSTDGGANWTSLYSVAGGPSITTIVAAPNATDVTILVGTETGALFRSADDGATFAAAGLSLPAEEVQSLAISPAHASDQTAWLSSRTDGVYRSTDGGVTWTLSSSGLTVAAQAAQLGRANFGEIVVRDNGGTNTLYVGGFDGLFRSDDGASTWTAQHTHVDYIVGIALSPDYANDQTVLVTTYVKGAYVSTDGGASWQPAHTGLGHVRDDGNGFAAVRRLYNAEMSPDFANDQRMFTVTPNRFAYSDDLGEFWNEVFVSTPTPPIRGPVIAVSPDFAVDQTVFFGTLLGDVHRSTGGGATSWTHLSNAGGRIRSLVVSPAFTADDTLFAGIDTGVVKSVDGGSTWSPTGPAASAPQVAISPNYAVDQTVFAATPAGLLVTTNGGTNWSTITGGPLTATSHIEAVAISPDFANDGVVLISEETAGLLKSVDSGVTFAATGTDLLANNLVIAEFNNPTEVPIEFSEDFANDQTVFAYAQQDIMKSTDGGATWQVLSLPPAVDMLGQPEIIARTGEAVVEPGGGGTVVASIPVDLSHPAIFDVEVDWDVVDATGNPALADHADVVGTSGHLVWNEGDDRLFVDVTVADDDVAELLETLEIQLSNPVNATIGTGSGFVDIADDDPLPEIRPLGVSAVEGDVGSTFHDFIVNMTHPSSTDVTIDYTSIDTANPQVAQSGVDYTAFSGTLTIPAGQVSATFPVEVLGDTIDEPPLLWGEWGLAAFSNPSSNATLYTDFFGLGLIIIFDDDDDGDNDD
ncbi:MAG: Calx-beta domain-containing protein [Acidimicrobiales bacterium]|nr:Calx-beta domain-containing protein [Acidimicrobiales bacterium]